MRWNWKIFPCLLGWAVLTAASHAAEFPKPWSPDRRYFGTDAFVPDWRAAEAIDEKASAHFLKVYWPKFKGDYEKGETGTPEGLSDEQKAAGVVVFTMPYTRALLPDELPKPAQSAFKAVRLFAARGESEPFIVGVRSLAQSKKVAIEVTDLASGPNRLAKENISCRLLLPYRAKTYAGHGRYKNVMRPMVLLKPPENRWTFPPNYSLAYVVDVHVPKDAPPGRYQGRVSVKAGEAVAKTFGLEVEVLPFTLKSNNYHAGAYGTTYGIWEGGFYGYYPEMIEMDARYGFNMAGAFFNKGQEIPFRKNKEGLLEVNPDGPKFKKFNATMKLLKQYGLGQCAFWCWGASATVRQFNNVLKAAGGYPGIQTAAGKKGFGEICRALKAAEKKYAWPEFVINPYDEALMDQDAVRQIIAGVHYVRERSPETRLYMTEWHATYTRLYQSKGLQLRGKSRPRGREYKALLASKEKPRLNFHVIGANKVEKESRQLQDELGGEYWHYTGINRLDAHARFAYGFEPWIVKAEACLIWANYRGDLSGKGWTLHYIMPLDPAYHKKKYSRGPVLASVRAIAAREGIDDRKYIETLKYYARTKQSKDDLKYLDTLSARCRVLAGNLKKIGGLDNVEATVSNADAFQKLRIEIKDRILKLLEK